MKIFVGTMYSGEGEIAQCCDMINKQQDVSIEHVIISHLPEREAHNALWDAWNERKQSFDLFVKIDADTVLIDTHTLKRIGDCMLSNTRITGFQGPLFDLMTNDFINGLNCFTPKVTFQHSKDDLFCDRNVDVNHDIVIKGKNLPDIFHGGVGYHCMNPTDIQAFHFGLHRALKGQFDIISKVKKAFEKLNDGLPRHMVLLGAHFAKFTTTIGTDISGNGHNLLSSTKDVKFNYTDPQFVKMFQEACKLLSLGYKFNEL